MPAQLLFLIGGTIFRFEPFIRLNSLMRFGLQKMETDAKPRPYLHGKTEAKMSEDFQKLMAHLFRHMEIHMPATCQQEVYSVVIDGKMEMKFFAAPETFLNIIATAGKLPDNVTTDRLLSILNLNCFTPIYPHFNFKIGVEPMKCNVEVWMREPLAALDADKLIVLFHFLQDVTMYVRDRMQQPLSQSHQAASFRFNALFNRPPAP